MRTHRRVAWGATALLAVVLPLILAPTQAGADPLVDADGIAFATAFARLAALLVFPPLALGTWIVSFAMASDERKDARRLVAERARASRPETAPLEAVPDA